jgi:hypothetical protein
MDKYLVRRPGLPNLQNESLAKEGIDSGMIRAANEEIEKVLSQDSAGTSGSVSRKRGLYGFYTSEQRA